MLHLNIKTLQGARNSIQFSRTSKQFAEHTMIIRGRTAFCLQALPVQQSRGEAV